MGLLNIIFTITVIDLVICQEETIKATLSNIPADGLLEFTELAEKYGHPAKEHDVTTKDGYILKMFNLPGDKRRPLLMAHGLFDSSNGWIIRGNKSLAIMLANSGYDVWALNFRGNRYSRRHVTMDPDKNATFWEFSSYEFGVYDLSACIDHVLNATGEKQLGLIGFSEGTTAAFILGSTLTEYNDKVKAFMALAPVVFLNNVRPLLSLVISWSPVLDLILPPSFVEMSGYYSLTKALLNIMCTQLVIGYELCYQGGMNSVSGMDSSGIDREFFKIVMGHFPAGTSRRNLMHFAQMGRRKSFARYDYGTIENLKLYSSLTPPVYDVNKVTMPTVLISAKNDPVSTIKDVEMLLPKLPNLEKFMVIESDNFNHLDHVWGKNACDIEYPYILDILAKHFSD